MPVLCFIWLLPNFRDFDGSSVFFDFENFVSFAFDHLKLVVQVIGLFILLLALMDQLCRTDSLEIRRIFGNPFASKIMDRSYSSVIRITYCILSLRHLLTFLLLLSSSLSWGFQDFQSDLDTLVAF